MKTKILFELFPFKFLLWFQIFSSVVPLLGRLARPGIIKSLYLLPRLMYTSSRWPIKAHGLSSITCRPALNLITPPQPKKIKKFKITMSPLCIMTQYYRVVVWWCPFIFPFVESWMLEVRCLNKICVRFCYYVLFLYRI